MLQVSNATKKAKWSLSSINRYFTEYYFTIFYGSANLYVLIWNQLKWSACCKLLFSAALCGAPLCERILENSKVGLNQEEGPKRKKEWKKGKKIKNSLILFLKEITETHVKESGKRKPQGHVCPPTQEGEMEQSINYCYVDSNWGQSNGKQEVMEWAKRVFCINMATDEPFHSLKQNCVIKAHERAAPLKSLWWILKH